MGSKKKAEKKSKAKFYWQASIAEIEGGLVVTLLQPPDGSAPFRQVYAESHGDAADLVTADLDSRLDMEEW
jgi:hypothetical protein